MSDEEFEAGRLPLPEAGDEASTLLGALDRIRATFAWKASGLSPGQMRTTLAPSTITLAGLLKHLAFVEDCYFTLRLQAWMPAPWDGVDWEATPDWTWTSALEDTPEQLHELWRAAVVRSRKAVAEALAHGDLGQAVRYSGWERNPNLRRTVVDLIEEYARHVGHADLVRESLDGLVGEDPPTG
jgi:Protein of unknown function (DUF664)